jgi:hypothetical protein
MNTATATMNSANIVLDFFEVVNCFEEEPEDDREGQKINYGVYCIHDWVI